MGRAGESRWVASTGRFLVLARSSNKNKRTEVLVLTRVTIGAAPISYESSLEDLCLSPTNRP